MNPLSKKTTLGISMIIKDECTNLPKSLGPLKEIADEIVVVDTGSRDGSRALAKSYGARVYDFPWVNDFSRARNQAILSARADYLLWLDADNYLAPAGYLKLKNLLPPPDAPPVILMAEEKVIPQGDRIWQKRVFPNLKSTRFVGRVHEQIEHPEDFQVIFSGVTITHWGYANLQEAKKKGERNLELLLNAPETKAGDYYYLYQLGKTLFNLRRFSEALVYLTQAKAKTPTHNPLWSHTLILISQIQSRTKDTQNAIQTLRDLNNTLPNYGPGRFYLGKLLFQEGFDALALEELEKAQGLSLFDPGWGADGDKFKFICLSLLGKLYLKMGAEQKATHTFKTL
ncbi:MAG: glycosyltransferase, partial [Deltaproteobacteria bacterium]|nr:glycosyltransferase [Deltaproteobacteria bacterium]